MSAPAFAMVLIVVAVGFLLLVGTIVAILNTYRHHPDKEEGKDDKSAGRFQP